MLEIYAAQRLILPFNIWEQTGRTYKKNRKSKGSGSTHLLKVQGEALLTSACSTHVKNKGDLSHIRISKRQIKNEFDTLSNGLHIQHVNQEQPAIME